MNGTPGEQSMIDDAEFVGRDDNDFRVQLVDDVQQSEAFSQRGKKTAGAFNQNMILVFLMTANERQHASQRNLPAVLAGGDQRGEGLLKMERVDFVECQRFVLHGA